MSIRIIKKKYHLLFISFLVTVPLIAGKYLLHELGWEVISLGSLHSSVVTGTFFVLGFLLSATITDYKESERIPAEVASILQNMYDDTMAIHSAYPDFDVKAFKRKVHRISMSVSDDIRDGKEQAQIDIRRLNEVFTDMEAAKVPANFIVKLKQQQAQLLRALLRVSYIQRIRFVPSATILARTIAVLVIGLIIFTEIEPFYGGLALVAILSLILVYVLRLIEVISTPFHRGGKTQDDVSLFLIKQTIDRLGARK
jgi:hypothetical protein